MENSHKYGQVKNDSLIDIDLNNFEEFSQQKQILFPRVQTQLTSRLFPEYNIQYSLFKSRIFHDDAVFFAFHKLHEATMTLHLSFPPYYRQQDGTQRIPTSQVIGDCPYRHLEVGLSVAMFSPDPMFEVSCPCP